MRKFLLPGILTAFALFLPSRSQANPLDIPTGGGWIQPSTGTTFAPGYFVGHSTYSVAFTTPTAGYQYCISHIYVSAPAAGTFQMWWSTSVITSGTTDYIAGITSGIPYVDEWAYRTPYCSPPNDELNLYIGVVGSTVTYEGYTFKGWNP